MSRKVRNAFYTAEICKFLNRGNFETNELRNEFELSEDGTHSLLKSLSDAGLIERVVDGRGCKGGSVWRPLISVTFHEPRGVHGQGNPHR